MLQSILIAILSVYNKQGLLDLAKGLIKHHIRLLGSGGTAKRESFDVTFWAFPIACVPLSNATTNSSAYSHSRGRLRDRVSQPIFSSQSPTS